MTKVDWGVFPASFEMRPIGAIYNFTPTVGVAQIKDYISLELQHYATHSLGSKVWFSKKVKGGKSEIKMPNIYSMSLKTSIVLYDDKPFLAGILTPHDKNGDPDVTRKAILMVRANIITVK